MRVVIEAPNTRIVIRTTTDLVPATIDSPSGVRDSTDGTYVAAVPGTYSIFLTREGAADREIVIRRAAVELATTTLALDAKFKLFRLAWGQRLEATVVVTKRTALAFDTFGTVFFRFAADSSERRKALAGDFGDGDLVLGAGTYRFVFEGDGDVRIAITRRLLFGR